MPELSPRGGFNHLKRDSKKLDAWCGDKKAAPADAA
jgi:hypothetical protein